LWPSDKLSAAEKLERIEAGDDYPTETKRPLKLSMKAFCMGVPGAM
jgi:hypothetical protein